MAGDIRYEWDETKAATNLIKHKVSFAEAATVFEDPHAIYFDNGSPDGRLCVIGISAQKRALFVVFVEKEEDVVRIISAREADEGERARYILGE